MIVQAGDHSILQPTLANPQTVAMIAIAAMMETLNALLKEDVLHRSVAERFVQVLSPYAPHITDELWARLGHDPSLAMCR